MPAQHRIVLVVFLLVFYIVIFTQNAFCAPAPTFSNLPSSINWQDEVEVDVSFAGDPKYYKDKTYYLRGVFYQSDSKYCAFTQNNQGQWVNSGSDPSQLFAFTTNQEGSWSGKLKVKYDPDDSNCSGSGEYYFKVARYTSTATWSDSTTLQITAPTPIPTITPTPKPTNTPKPTATATPSTSTTSSSDSQSEVLSENEEEPIGIVAGAKSVLNPSSTYSATIEINPIKIASTSSVSATELTLIDEDQNKVKEEKSNIFSSFSIILGLTMLSSGGVSILVRRYPYLKNWLTKK